MKILIVDDDTLILEILELYLGTIDYDDVTCADSAAGALHILKTSKVAFDCIFLDISMPEMTGVEAIPHIRSLSDYAQTPIVMMTAVSDKRHIASAFVAGANDYISKPFEFFELETQLQAAKTHRETMSFGNSTAAKAVDDTIKSFVAQQRPLPGDAIQQSGLMTESAFENCLRMLKRETLRKPAMLTLQMRNFVNLQHDVSAEDAEAFLLTLCKQLRVSIGAVDGIATYIGDGTFLAMTFATKSETRSTLTEVIRAAVADAEAEFEKQRDSQARFALSEIRVHSEPHQSEPNYLIYAAKARAAHLDPGERHSTVGDFS